MQKIYIITTVFLTAVFFSQISFSLIALASLFWFWRVEIDSRVWLALACGFFMDTFSLLPFGTHMLILFFLAIFTSMLRLFFTDARPWVIWSVGLAMTFVIFITVTPYLGQLLS